MNSILSQIEKRIREQPEDGDKSVAINLHQIWFLYIIVLHLAIFYNIHHEKVSAVKAEFLSSLKKPALGTLLGLCRYLGGAYSFSESGDKLKNSLEHHLGMFIKIRNERIGHAFPISSDELAQTLRLLQEIKTQITEAANNCTEKGVVNYIGNPGEITCKSGETFLSLNLDGEIRTLRISPFIHVNEETGDIYIFRSITKEILGQVSYYKISDASEDYTLSWNELALPTKIGKRDAYQECHSPTYFQEIIVDAHGHGDVLSINEALAIAGEQTMIIVKPGIYCEKLVIDKQVLLCGENGHVGAPIIRSNGNSPCVEISAPAHLKNLRITNDLMENPGTAIVVNSNAKIEDVEICQWNGNGIIINANADSKILGCVFENISSCGIDSYSQMGKIENCKFINCFDKNKKKKSPAIYVEKDACIDAASCEFVNSFSAIYTTDGYSVTLEKCVIHNCRYAMTIVGAKTKIAACTFEENFSNPYFERCEVSIIDSNFLKTHESGEIHGSNVELSAESCIFSEFTDCGILLSDSNNCKIRKCEFLKIGTGIDLNNSANCTIQDCKFLDVERIGVNSCESSGSLRNCQFLKLHRGVELYNSKDFTIRDCNFQDIKRTGINSYESGISISECDFSKVSSYAVFAENSRDFSLHKCKIRGGLNSSQAVYLCDVAGEVCGCDIFGFENIAMNVMGVSNVDVFLSTFNNNNDISLKVAGNSEVVVDQCKFYQNGDRVPAAFLAEGEATLTATGCD